MKEDWQTADLLEEQDRSHRSEGLKAGTEQFREIWPMQETVALGDPDSVPRRPVCERGPRNLNLWDEVSAKASFGTNVTGF